MGQRLLVARTNLLAAVGIPCLTLPIFSPRSSYAVAPINESNVALLMMILLPDAEVARFRPHRVGGRLRWVVVIALSQHPA
ncbi:hypothetical protein ATM97_27170 [Nocardia sp. MH4]|nr:hypothetical protein [Nocardia sp. MH4]